MGVGAPQNVTLVGPRTTKPPLQIQIVWGKVHDLLSREHSPLPVHHERAHLGDDLIVGVDKRFDEVLIVGFSHCTGSKLGAQTVHHQVQ